MKSLLRSSILALVVFAGIAAVSANSTSFTIPGSTSCPKVHTNASFCVQ
jgi:hypothetical protein